MKIPNDADLHNAMVEAEERLNSLSVTDLDKIIDVLHSHILNYRVQMEREAGQPVPQFLRWVGAIEAVKTLISLCGETKQNKS